MQTLSFAVGEVAEGSDCGAHILRGQPESPGDEEQHREVQEDEGGDRGRLSGQRAAQGDTLGESVAETNQRTFTFFPRQDWTIHGLKVYIPLSLF